MRFLSEHPAVDTCPRFAFLRPISLRTLVFASVVGAASLPLARAEHKHENHEHNHGAQSDEPVERPRVFLDKSPRIVAYQLKRLTNERLLLVERKTDDVKYLPVYSAILSRAGMSRNHRDEALAGIVAIKKSDPVTELLSALQDLKTESEEEIRTAEQVAAMVLSVPADKLQQKAKDFEDATTADSAVVRQTSYAAMLLTDRFDDAAKLAAADDDAQTDFLLATTLLPKAKQRKTMRSYVLERIVDKHALAVRRAAITALADIPVETSEHFEKLAPLFADKRVRNQAVATLLKIPAKQREATAATELLNNIVKFAEDTPAAKRTTDRFVDVMQLADQLLASVPSSVGKPAGARLREISVRVVRIQTIEEEMRYDVPFFAVEAGRPVQVVLRNEDLMPHNLVITVPDALQEVAEAGALLGPTSGHSGKAYVPKSDKVLFATNMVPPHRQERLTFTAPKEPGEYPFVCTFPRHWMRMYGVMVVTDKLDEFLANPVPPKDPIGSNRAFVKSWTVDDLAEKIDIGLRGRTRTIGERLFKEATCAQCHKIRGEGGAVGPELTDVFKRWKNDRVGILREILDPSHKIDPKYAVRVIVLDSGQVISGIVKGEDKETISVLSNPESPKPVVVQKDDIDESVQSAKSMMPKALLDRFSEDEIFEILGYLESSGQ